MITFFRNLKHELKITPQLPKDYAEQSAVFTFFKNLKHAFKTMPQLLRDYENKNNKLWKLNNEYERKLDEIKRKYIFEGRLIEYQELCKFISEAKTRYL